MQEVEKKPGYLISLIMDYGSGRQIQISGNLPLGTSKEQFDEELDKLRLATNRQQAFVILRDTDAKLRAEKKLAAALTHMLAEYDKEMEKEMERLTEHAPKHSSGKARSSTTTQIENMRAQALNFKLNKKQEIQQHETNVAIYEVTVASIKKEIGLEEKAESEG